MSNLQPTDIWNYGLCYLQILLCLHRMGQIISGLWCSLAYSYGMNRLKRQMLGKSALYWFDIHCICKVNTTSVLNKKKSGAFPRTRWLLVVARNKGTAVTQEPSLWQRKSSKGKYKILCFLRQHLCKIYVCINTSKHCFIDFHLGKNWLSFREKQESNFL